MAMTMTTTTDGTSNAARAARFWDGMAKRYAAARIGDMAGYERTLARTAELVRDAAVVEIGCGTGTTALRLAPHAARYVATDVSPRMIEIARGKHGAGGPAHLSFAIAAADAPVAGEGSCDVVLAFNLIHLVPERAALLARAHAMLRPGGLFVTKTPCLAEMTPLIRLLVPVLRLIGKAPPVAFFTGAALEAAIARAGFAIEERARHGSSVKDPRVFLVARKL
jgi:SAM-dependent methyltransferase